MIQTPATEMEETVADVADAARAHGIGLILFGEDARRVAPNPERLNAFVATQLSDTTRDLISRRLR